MSKILQEPLMHFLLLSGALFLIFQLVSDVGFSQTEPLEEIVVSEGRIQMLVLGFEKVWQRKPNSTELDGLIESFVHEEVMYREAKAMGLDRDDAVVRRRMRQKLEFISEDLIKLEPSDEQLQLFLDENPARFRQETRFSFRQLYFNVSERGESVDAYIQQTLTTLKSATEGSEDIRADQLMIPSRFSAAAERDIIRTLGRQFLDELQSVPVGDWYGPVNSGFGLHLVHISHRVEGSVPGLADIHAIVEREWTMVARKKSNQEFYDALRQRYKVKIATISAAAPNVKPAVAKNVARVSN